MTLDKLPNPALGHKMIAGISFKRWFDDDLVEFEITTSDGVSLFCTKVCAGHLDLEELIADLDRFKSHVHGGIYDVRLGAFGPEYASGAFQARLHFHKPGRGRLFITVNAQSDWRDFTMTKVASQAILYLTSEPALFDNFIEDLKRLQAGETDEATLLSA